MIFLINVVICYGLGGIGGGGVICLSCSCLCGVGRGGDALLWLTSNCTVDYV